MKNTFKCIFDSLKKEFGEKELLKRICETIQKPEFVERYLKNDLSVSSCSRVHLIEETITAVFDSDIESNLKKRAIDYEWIENNLLIDSKFIIEKINKNVFALIYPEILEMIGYLTKYNLNAKDLDKVSAFVWGITIAQYINSDEEEFLPTDSFYYFRYFVNGNTAFLKKWCEINIPEARNYYACLYIALFFNSLLQLYMFWNQKGALYEKTQYLDAVEKQDFIHQTELLFFKTLMLSYQKFDNALTVEEDKIFRELSIDSLDSLPQKCARFWYYSGAKAEAPKVRAQQSKKGAAAKHESLNKVLERVQAMFYNYKYVDKEEFKYKPSGKRKGELNITKVADDIFWNKLKEEDRICFQKYLNLKDEHGENTRNFIQENLPSNKFAPIKTISKKLKEFS